MNQLALRFDPLPAQRRRGYFCTTRLTDDELAAALERAESQTDAVLAVFRRHVALTPSQAHAKLRRPCLLTSVRRSITVLTGERVLRKTDRQVPGPHGAPESVWELAA